MKYFLLFILAIVGIQTSFAQITLTISDLASPGDSITENTINNQDEIPAIGSNQTYNFLSTSAVGSDETTNYLNPASTPFAASIPGSNLAAKTGDSYTYYQKDATGFYLSGLVIPTAGFPINLNFDNAPLNFVQKMPILSFPATFGMNQIAQTTTKFEFPFDTVVTLNGLQATITKVRINGIIKDTSKIDGFGTVELPGGSFSCLRNIQTLKLSFTAEVFAKISIFPAVWVNFPVDIPNITVKQVLLWGNGNKSPIVAMQLDSTGNVLGSSVQKMFLTNNRPLLSAQPEFEFEPFPNPASDFLNLSSQKRLKYLKLFSLEGKKINEFKLQAADKVIQIGTINNGIYWAEVESEDGNLSRKKLIINK